MRLKMFVVASLEAWCGRLHWVFHHQPWLTLVPWGGICPLASLSDRLDQRWGTGWWDIPEPIEDRGLEVMPGSSTPAHEETP
jgi:hypothetical protein